MQIFNRFWAIFVIAIKRIFSQPWMALATVLGMIFAISLSMSVPLYASSVYNRIFLQRVGVIPGETNTPSHPPFSFLYTYDSNILGNLEWPSVQAVDEFLQKEPENWLGLPIQTSVRYFSTNPLALFPASIQSFPDDQKPLLWSSLSFMSDLESKVTMVEGRFPQPSLEPGTPIEVMISANLAIDLGFQVDERYTLFARDQIVDGRPSTTQIPVVITGVYQPINTNDPYWFVRPDLLKERLMVPEETYTIRVADMLGDEVYSAFWYMLADGSEVRPDMAMSMVRRIQSFQRQAEQHLPRIRLSISPIESLYAYQRAANLLTILLFAFSVPIFGLLLAFITMTSGMTVERQRNEIAVLRSRGAMVAQMIGIASVEALLLSGLAFLISLPASAAIAWAIGHTRSFLDFSGAGPVGGMDINWTPTTLYFGVAAIALAWLARLFPTIRAARENVVSYKRERSRNLSTPVWQRIGLEFLLMIPAGYGIYLLRQQGTIDTLNASSTGDPFSNPLLIMIPALVIFSLSLFFLRLMPMTMSGITWLASRTRSVGMMMAARHLARTPTTYTLPLVLLILTLSLSAFTATLAGTLDNHLHDQIYYQIGSDVNFLDLGDSPDEPGGMGGAPTAQGGQSAVSDVQPSSPTTPGWFFLPVTEYVQLSEVQDATRVGRYPATAVFGSRYQSGEVLGIDRYNLPGIAYWRQDFARTSLGELMNRLASRPNGILVSESFLAENSLNENDLVTLRVVNYQKTTEVDFQVVGTFNLFPTYYPSKGQLFVVNLDYLFESLGGQYPYDVWMRSAGDVNVEQLSAESRTLLGARTLRWREPATLISREQARPERQGLFGVLSVGFGAAALLTVIGFLLYALLSYQRRFVELGVLRAVGLSSGQMTTFLAAELAFLILMGGFIGTALGVWVSNLFIPYLQIGADPAAQIPPYVVHVAWSAIMRVYFLFALLFVVALTTLIILLRRMKIFQAIKMGESV
jgi:putative ABC transport system permease protein